MCSYLSLFNFWKGVGLLPLSQASKFRVETKTSINVAVSVLQSTSSPTLNLALSAIPRYHCLLGIDWLGFLPPSGNSVSGSLAHSFISFTHLWILVLLRALSQALFFSYPLPRIQLMSVNYPQIDISGCNLSLEPQVSISNCYQICFFRTHHIQS